MWPYAKLTEASQLNKDSPHQLPSKVVELESCSWKRVTKEGADYHDSLLANLHVGKPRHNNQIGLGWTGLQS